MTTLLKAVMVSAGIVASVTSCAWAAAGDLDVTFDADGIVTTDVSFGDFVGGIALQPDGRIVVAGTSGWFNLSGDHEYDRSLVRYDPDGTLDSTFDGDGKIVHNLSQDDSANAVAALPDGRIVVAGSDGNQFLLTRHIASGTLDASFDSDGIVASAFPLGSAVPHALVLAGNGQTIVAGGQGTSPYDLALARYNTDGTLDSAFDGDGMVTTDFGTADDTAVAVELQADGKILVVVASGSIARYSGNGALDPSFGSGGTVVTAMDRALDATLQPDGRLIVAGGNPSGQAVLARYTANGIPDATFDGDGLVSTADGTLLAVALSPGGKIVVVRFDSVAFAIALSRYQADGSLDASFNGAAISGVPKALAVQTDGRVIEARDSALFGASSDFVLARYLGGWCPLAPDAACVTGFEKGQLLISEKRTGKEKVTVKLTNGPELVQGDFGDPLGIDGTTYALCIYDSAGALAGELAVSRAGDTCAGKPCWKPIGDLPPGGKGYRYSDKLTSADGVKRMQLKGGAGTGSKLQLKGQNNVTRGQLALPTGIAARLTSTTNATVQLRASDAGCFSVTLAEIAEQQINSFKAK